jgi:hypothetical protein
MTRSTVPSIDACMAAQHKALCWPCRLQLSQHSSYAVLRGAARKLNSVVLHQWAATECKLLETRKRKFWSAGTLPKPAADG